MGGIQFPFYFSPHFDQFCKNRRAELARCPKFLSLFEGPQSTLAVASHLFGTLGFVMVRDVSLDLG
jgi:hypothetical protein